MPARLAAVPRAALAWAAPAAVGAGIGAAVAAARRLELLEGVARSALGASRALDAAVGPVWIPMALVALRAAWLVGNALLTRAGHGAVGRPVRPELVQLAPLFAALGLAGTVWGLRHAFDALQDGEFLARLPSLLGGLGAAMTSTLVGLGLQVVTLLAATFSPAWSLVRVEWDGASPGFSLDGRALGAGDSGLAALVDSLRARQPEALRIAFARGVPASERRAVGDALWERTDAAIPIREVGR